MISTDAPQDKPVGGSPIAPAAERGSAPEQVRKKWDALLSVINSVSADAPDGADAAQRTPLRAARDLLSETSASAKSSSGGPRRKRAEWNNRHHLSYSVCNSTMQKNVRSYFDRPRDIESYGLRCDDPLRTTWQLETPEDIPPKALPKSWGGGGGVSLPALTDAAPSSPAMSLPAASDKAASPKAAMSRSASSPTFGKKPEWNMRHHVKFCKDNHHYHANMREYFERPRGLLY